MPNLTNITLVGAAPGNTNYLFTPQSSDGGQTVWRVRTGAYTSQPVLSFSIKENRETGANKTVIKIAKPVTATITDPVTGVPVVKKLSEPLIVINHILPHDLAEADRLEMYALGVSALSQTILRTAITNGEAIIGG